MEHSPNDLPVPNRDAADRVLAESMAQQQADASRPTVRHLGFRVDLGSRDGCCESHGEFTEAGFKLGSGVREFWSGCGKCAAARQVEEREAQLAEERRRQAERRDAAIAAADIPLRFRTKTFSNFVAETRDKQRALTVARDYAEQFPALAPKGHGLVFSGLPGTGKSHLAAAIMQSLIDGRRSIQYVTCMGLIRAVRETWRRDSEDSERRVLAKFGCGIDLLVIDEVGVQYGTDGEQTILFEILDRRYAEMRPTILLTNQDRDGFRSFIGDRVFDRLAETCRWVPFDWDSYRPTARRESA